jgi:MSHA pilin protein MshD
MVMNYTVQHSADPMLQRQALAIAESYLEEVLLQSFNDPDGGIEPNRSLFDDVGDYNGLNDIGARDQAGNAILGLGFYTVSMTVTPTAFNGIPLADCRRVTVTVSHPSGISLSLSGHSTNY